MPVNCNGVRDELMADIPEDANIRLWVGAWRAGSSWNHAKIIAVDGKVSAGRLAEDCMDSFDIHGYLPLILFETTICILCYAMQYLHTGGHNVSVFAMHDNA